MKVVFVSQYFAPEPGATSELLAGIAEELAKAGMNVNAIAGQPSYFATEKLPKDLVINGIKVRRIWSTQSSKNSTLGRVLNTASFSASLFISLLVLSPRDRIFVAVTTPPTLPLICYAAHLIRRGKYVAVIHDVYPDIAVELGALRERGLVARLWRFFNRRAFRRASAIVALGRDMHELLLARYGQDLSARMKIIPNWADGDVIKPIERTCHPNFTDAESRHRFIVQYSATLADSMRLRQFWMRHDISTRQVGFVSIFTAMAINLSLCGGLWMSYRAALFALARSSRGIKLEVH